ncbi:MAG: hypothetical protein LBJ71_02305 [Holosporaceae bacterium]|nr:hypothetical protein [Holosporaceae bacterium]
MQQVYWLRLAYRVLVHKLPKGIGGDGVLQKMALQGLMTLHGLLPEGIGGDGVLKEMTLHGLVTLHGLLPKGIGGDGVLQEMALHGLVTEVARGLPVLTL